MKNLKGFPSRILNGFPFIFEGKFFRNLKGSALETLGKSFTSLRGFPFILFHMWPLCGNEWKKGVLYALITVTMERLSRVPIILLRPYIYI